MRSIFTLVSFMVLGMYSASAQVSRIEQKSHENNSPSRSSGGGDNSGSSGSRSSSGSSSYKYSSDDNESNYSSYDYQYQPSQYEYRSSGGCYPSYPALPRGERLRRSQGAIGGAVANQYQRIRDIINPMYTSLEFMPHIAYGSMEILSYLPRVRATYGPMSIDFRITSLKDMGPSEGGTYYTYDLQVMQLNIINRRNVGLYVGGGLMLEHTSTTQNSFLELGGGLLLREFGPWSCALEVRKTGVAVTGITARREGGMRVSYEILKKKPLHVNLTGGWMVQNYYESISVASVLGGFTMVLK